MALHTHRAGSTNRFPAMEPCCRLQAEKSDVCDTPSAPGEVKCRSVTINNAACPTTSTDFCDVQAMTLDMSLTFQTANQTCCSSCTCYGDPHCEAFDGQTDTWVVCDARVIKPNTENQQCPLSKSMCLQQLDNLGNPCVWQPNPTGKKWNIALQGSQCIFSNQLQPPTMIMYKADNFTLELIMGERSIIQALLITDTNSGAGYYMSAADCVSMAGSDPPGPWRVSPNKAAPTDPTWLPYGFQWTTLSGGDILWSITTLPSQVDMSIRCTRTIVMSSTGVAQYGAPRLNIEQLVEPYNYLTQRKNAGGFCAKGTIDKQGTTSNTDYLTSLGACELQSDDLVVGKVLCSPGLTQQGVVGCKIQWCNSVRSDLSTCLDDIATYGWDHTYCASKTVPDKQASECTTGNCAQCVHDIADFGWAAAVNTWNSVVSQSGGDCVTRAQLPPALVECQDGVNIQYLNSENVWTTYLGVPSFVALCNNKITFDSVADQVLFQYPVRAIQCSQPSSCLSNACLPAQGFTASFLFTATPDTKTTVYDLFASGVLVCNPKVYSNSTSCVNANVPKMCPCSS